MGFLHEKVKGPIMKTFNNLYPKYWSSFSFILNFFKLFGILPLSIKLPRENQKRVPTKFSFVGSLMAVLLTALTFLHAIWGPQMHSNLNKNMSNDTTKPITLNTKIEYAHMKIASFIQTLYPWLGSLTSVVARLLGLFTTVKSLPTLLNTLCRVDYFLPLASRYSLTNFKTLTILTALGYILHIPVIVIHGMRVSGFTNLRAKIWQVISMLNVLTTFSVELQFCLLCWSIRCRFAYINNLLGLFVAPEFNFDEGRRQIAGGIFHRWKNFIKQRNRKIYLGDCNSKTNVFVTAFSDAKHEEPEQYLRRLDWPKMPNTASAKLLKSLRRSHILLHDAMERLNNIYHFYLFLTILSSIVKFLVYCYYILFGYLSAKTESSLRNGTPLIVIWCSYYCVRFLVLVMVAHFTVDSSRQARNILSKINWRDLEVVCRQEIKMFSHHLSRRNFEFSACGLFALNTSLISTSFSTTVTYIVIMAQLH